MSIGRRGTWAAVLTVSVSFGIVGASAHLASAGTDHPDCAGRIEVPVNGPTYTVPSGDWASVWTKAGSDPHINRGPLASGTVITSQRFNQNGGELDISHVDLCPEQPPSTDPSTPPTDPSTPPTDPSTPPTDPSTPPTDPSTPPTDPSTPPTDPSTPPTDPSTPPTDPSTPPTDPSTPPTDPSTPPTDPSTPQPSTTDVNVEVLPPITPPAGPTATSAPAATAAPAADVTGQLPVTGSSSNGITILALLALGAGAALALTARRTRTSD
jgi:LPXTG-motif cell wall-anchored protein